MFHNYSSTHRFWIMIHMRIWCSWYFRMVLRLSAAFHLMFYGLLDHRKASSSRSCLPGQMEALANRVGRFEAELEALRREAGRAVFVVSNVALGQNRPLTLVPFLGGGNAPLRFGLFEWLKLGVHLGYRAFHPQYYNPRSIRQEIKYFRSCNFKGNILLSKVRIASRARQESDCEKLIHFVPQQCVCSTKARQIKCSEPWINELT